jgi:hypothetical protein
MWFEDAPSIFRVMGSRVRRSNALESPSGIGVAERRFLGSSALPGPSSRASKPSLDPAHCGPGYRFRLGRSLFYWVLARELLPSGWRWFAACVNTSRAGGDPAMLGLGQSALLRLDRALRARDRMQIQYQLPQNNDVACEALFYLDVVLISLIASFDAVGRVAHEVYGIAGPSHSVGWRRGPWRSALEKSAPHLATMTELGSGDRDVLELAALLRNTVHGAALRSIQVRGSGTEETLVEVPPDEESALLNCVDRSGGEFRWGIRRLGGRVFLDAQIYVEVLMPLAAETICRLMDATEVERLPGVTGSTLPIEPPTDEVWKPDIRTAVRLLSGLP